MEAGFVKVAFLPVVATALSKHSPLLSSDRRENQRSPLHLQMTAFYFFILPGHAEREIRRERGRERDGVKPSDEPTDGEKSGECSCMRGGGGCEKIQIVLVKKKINQKKGIRSGGGSVGVEIKILLEC